ncbi:MAG: GerMN domain-containing protein [Thermacetogeniaceae bacterium]
MSSRKMHTGLETAALRAAALLAALMLLLTAAGCGFGGKKEPAPSSQKKAEARQTVTLYFSDNEAMYLIPEEREVTPGDRQLAEVVVEELIKGPKSPGLSRTIPPEARLLGVKVENGVAYVDFSKEIQTKHWGGSAGEAMTIFSVVNSLARLPGIERVQFLVEGKVPESLVGHADTMQPIAPNWSLVKQRG